MKKFSVMLIALITITSMLSGCLTNEAGEIDKQTVVGLAGAVGGGIIGSNIGKGVGNTAAIIGGTVLGGLVGSEIGKSLNKADVAYHTRAQARALESNRAGTTSTWKNPDSGASGSITPTKTYDRDGQNCREFTQTIRVGGKTQTGYGTACRDSSGDWQIQK